MYEKINPEVKDKDGGIKSQQSRKTDEFENLKSSKFSGGIETVLTIINFI